MTTAPHPRPAAPRPPADLERLERLDAGHARLDAQLDTHLDALAERPVAEHAEAYARLHEDLTERLRGTER